MAQQGQIGLILARMSGRSSTDFSLYLEFYASTPDGTKEV
jgi:hypothetical protein